MAMSKGKEEMLREVMGDVEEKGRALFEWREAHPRATLAEIEEEAGKVRREMMGEVMERVMEWTGRGYEVEGVRCEACGEEMKFQGYRENGVQTMEGEVRIPRAYYYCPRCKRGGSPLDRVLGLRRGSWSEGVEKGGTRLGAELPYSRAAETYRELTGVWVSAKSVEVITKRNGQALGKVVAQERAWALAEDIEVRGAEGEEERGRWGVSVDGTTILTRELSDCAGLWKPEEVGEALGAETRRRGIDTVQEDVAVGIGEGAAWIWKQMHLHYPQAEQIVDGYHAAERVWGVGQAVYGQGSEKAREWVERPLTALWEGDVRGVGEEIRRLRPRRAEAREAVREAKVYFTNQERRMQDARFREEGYPLGSGSVESACKTLVGARLKRGGMRGSDKGAEAVLNLRSELLSHRWNEAWKRLRQFT